jgi:hypothetical protein
MGGGAWPFLVRGMICLVNSDNERDQDPGLTALVLPDLSETASEGLTTC